MKLGSGLVRLAVVFLLLSLVFALYAAASDEPDELKKSDEGYVPFT